MKFQSNPHHDYQPGWTVVGSGLANKQDFRRPLADLIPSHIGHIPSKAEGYEPGSNQVVLSDGSKVSYDYLVVAPGLKLSMLPFAPASSSFSPLICLSLSCSSRVEEMGGQAA